MGRSKQKTEMARKTLEQFLKERGSYKVAAVCSNCHLQLQEPVEVPKGFYVRTPYPEHKSMMTDAYGDEHIDFEFPKCPNCDCQRLRMRYKDE